MTRLKGTELLIAVSAVLVLTGLVLPLLRTRRLERDAGLAVTEMERIAAGIREFLEDTGSVPSRGQDGRDGQIYRLCGPGRIPAGSYFGADRHQGWLADHLLVNEPAGPAAAGYAGWRGPYLPRLRPDPWGGAYVVVLYPAFRHDERDCIVICAGPNGRMDSQHSSPFNLVPAGDDLVVKIFDKSHERRAPLGAG